ncbi:MAG: lecithin retinol acyltransferase family protein [Candidatus Sumerlaeia bacterium]|nr:lecithin retinol acyltransferase family protein [Candidatus Sumerlaeia bacterium]
MRQNPDCGYGNHPLRESTCICGTDYGCVTKGFRQSTFDQGGCPMARGDHLRVWRGCYYHHGIEVENGKVVHFIGEPLSKSNAKIRQTSMEVFLKGGEKEVVEYSKSDPPGVVVRRALSRLGESGYDLFSNNCEHFARWCKTGKHESEQVRAATAGAGATVGTGAAVYGSIAGVSAAGAVQGLSAAGVMSGLAAIGPGGVVGGIATLASAPAIFTNIAVRSVLKDDEALAQPERNARTAGRVGGMIGTVAGAAGTIGTISASGTVAGLSGAGISSGLAAIGGTVGGGMVAGTAMCIVAPAAAAVAGAFLLYKLWKWFE